MTETKDKRLTALRGAARAQNRADDIQEQVALLYDELLAENGLKEADIVSLVFSVTKDLDALNPASALRKPGRAANLALMVFQEAAFENSLSGTIRVLIHCYLDGPPRHIYRNGAEVLRPDRSGGTSK